jgi:hypothetical protein
MMKRQASGAFLKKSAQKTFMKLDRARFNACGPVEQKFFAAFFSKRKRLLAVFPGRPA